MMKTRTPFHLWQTVDEVLIVAARTGRRLEGEPVLLNEEEATQGLTSDLVVLYNLSCGTKLVFVRSLGENGEKPLCYRIAKIKTADGSTESIEGMEDQDDM